MTRRYLAGLDLLISRPIYEH